MHARAALQDLLTLAERQPAADDEIVVTGRDPVLPTNDLAGSPLALLVSGTPTCASRTSRISSSNPRPPSAAYAMWRRRCSCRKHRLIGPDQPSPSAFTKRSGRRDNESPPHHSGGFGWGCEGGVASPDLCPP
jgi:hypothetical protein